MTELKTITILIRITPQGDEYEIEVSNLLTGKELLDELLDHKLMPRYFPNSTDPVVYEIMIQETGRAVKDSGTLASSGVDDGSILYVVPKITAGGYPGNLIYYLPDKFQKDKKAQCTVRIGKKELETYLLEEGLLQKSYVENIEMNDLMIVRLEENATEPCFKIVTLSEEEQIISDGYFSQWVFELHPMKTGFSSLILRISMPQMLEGFGERRKDVFLLNREVEITSDEEAYSSGTLTLEEIFQWTEEAEQLKTDVYQNIGKNETGQALTKLINFFQKSDVDLLNAMVLFQAQWNDGRNKSLLGVISQIEWMMVQNKVNYGILEIMKNLENQITSKEKNLPLLKRISDEMNQLVK